MKNVVKTYEKRLLTFFFVGNCDFPNPGRNKMLYFTDRLFKKKIRNYSFERIINKIERTKLGLDSF